VYAITPSGPRHLLVKFSEAEPSPVSERWRDLLLAEHLALEVLREAGWPAAQTHIVDFGGQRFFESHRFDARAYESFRELLSQKVIPAPACLVTRVSGDGKFGLQAYEQLKQRGLHIPVVFLAEQHEVQLAVKAMRAGAEDIVAFPFDGKALVDSVARAIDRSRKFLLRTAQEERFRQRSEMLTQREREVVKLIISGMLNREIAGNLGISLVTVKFHRGNAMRKLEARTSAELFMFARQAGLLTRGDAIIPKQDISKRPAQ
jgi:FixJ family two-component response regulator